MDYLENALLKKQGELKKLINRLEHLPCLKVEGQIKVKRAKASCIQYRRKKEDRFNCLGKHELPIGMEIAQRDYVKKLLRRAKEQLLHVEKLLDFYDSKALSEVYHDLNPSRKLLVTNYCLTDEEYADAWLKKPYPSHNKYEVTNGYPTNRGEIVRSKTEKIIADWLHKMNIPYRYEYPVKLYNGHTVYPDFMILNKRTRKVYVLEHLGMLEDAEYLKKNCRKILDYMLSGYVLGKNLLISGEMDGHGLDMRILERYAEECWR